MTRLLFALACISSAAASAASPDLSDGLRLNGGLSWGLGTMNNSTKTIAYRTVNMVSLTAMPAWRWNQFFAGPVLEWRIVGQNTEPRDVGNTNLRGYGYMLGAALGYQWSSFQVYAGMDFLGKHILYENTSGGQESRYNKPIGVRGGFGYFFHENFAVNALVMIDSYRQNLFGAQDVDISASKLTQRTYALGLSAHY